MKILKGNLTETRYDFPDDDAEKPMRLKSEKIHKENAVAYMADDLGLHRVSNQGSDYAVSLHRRYSFECRASSCHLADEGSIHPAERGQVWLQHLQP